MKIVTLNLRHGGGKRIPKIGNYLENADADIVVLSEYRAGLPGKALEERLVEMGYSTLWPSIAEPKINGVIVASRIPSQKIQIDAETDDAKRIIGCHVNGLDIFGVYFALGHDKLKLYQLIEQHSAKWTERPSMLIGDFNTGRHRIDESGSTLTLSDRFTGLEQDHAWTDMWRHFHGPEAREFSWYSPMGNGFRLDHMLASEAAKSCIRSVEYDHTTRPEITDHSAMIATLDI